jgi:multicomponent Na+:H+ antiporter subunit D
MWLADAHAVAPSPVSVIFSGIMVSVALFALAKFVAQVFIRDAEVMALVHVLLLWLGAATALIGGAMAFAQRHLKRLLAFSTIAHLGIMLTGVAAVTPAGFGGFVLYLFGHGLIKATLFMIAGILLAVCATGDEIGLYGMGRRIWPAGVVMAIAGLLLGGLPIGLLHDATESLASRSPATAAVIVVATALTGAAVLRAAARIFLGWSGAPGVEITAPTAPQREKNNRGLALMLVPCVGLLAVAVVPGWLVTPFLGTAGARLIDPFGGVAAPMPLPPISILTFAPIAVTLALLLFALLRERPTRSLARNLFRLELLPFRGMQFLHSGLVGDYVAWMLIGLAALAGFLAY